MNDQFEAAAVVEFECEECGKYEVIKSKATLLQYCCGCGIPSKPLRIIRVGIKTEGVWKNAKLNED